MKEKFLRYIAGQQFLIEPSWGYEQLTKVDALSDIVTTDAAFFDRMKQESQAVDYFQNGNVSAVSDEVMENSIARVSFSGVMTVEDGLCHYGVKSFDRTMRMLYADDRVNAIVIDMNSGGGQAAAGNLYYNTLLDKNKPVITHYHLMASAALLGSLKSDEIIAASDMSQAGSIGVMMNIPKYLLNAEDERNDTLELYSKDSQRKNEIWRALEQGNTELIVDLLTELDGLFMDRVKQDRRLKGRESTREQTLSGAMFRAAEAKRRGLIDGVGSFNYVLQRAISAMTYK
jgi:protease-4